MTYRITLPPDGYDDDWLDDAIDKEHRRAIIEMLRETGQWTGPDPDADADTGDETDTETDTETDE